MHAPHAHAVLCPSVNRDLSRLMSLSADFCNDLSDWR